MDYLDESVYMVLGNAHDPPWIMAIGWYHVVWPIVSGGYYLQWVGTWLMVQYWQYYFFYPTYFLVWFSSFGIRGKNQISGSTLILWGKTYSWHGFPNVLISFLTPSVKEFAPEVGRLAGLQICGRAFPGLSKYVFISPLSQKVEPLLPPCSS